MLRSDLLLYGLDQELRNLGRAKLFPREGRLGARAYDDAYGVGNIVDGQRV